MKISQCMIVKNEAHNLEKSLGNLKDVVYEQIVIDTGSTDNTVEVALALGAKVLHFNWINDFAAAKNYAIDQAQGDWIVFFDADEYVDKNKAESLPLIIEKAKKAKATTVRLDMLHLDENNKVFFKGMQDRIFINRKDIRYVGKVHEQLMTKRNGYKIYYDSSLPIYHTGYISSNIADKDKGKRNLDLVLQEVERNPDDPQLYNYLADAYKMLKETDKVLECFKKTISKSKEIGKVVPITMMQAYQGVLSFYASNSNPIEDAKPYYDEVIAKYGDDPDIHFYMAQIYQNNGEKEKAIECFEKSVSLSTDAYGRIFNASFGKLVEINKILLTLYNEINDKRNAVKKAILLLEYDKYQLAILIFLLQIFLTEEKDADVYKFMLRIYDLEIPKDRMYLYAASLKCSNPYLQTELEKILSNSEIDEVKAMIEKS